MVPDYSALKARKDLNRAWRDILDKRTWSFLVAEGAFTAPPSLQEGSVQTRAGLRNGDSGCDGGSGPLERPAGLADPTAVPDWRRPGRSTTSLVGAAGS